jgi:hypothetical protein
MTLQLLSFGAISKLELLASLPWNGTTGTSFWMSLIGLSTVSEDEAIFSNSGIARSIFVKSGDADLPVCRVPGRDWLFDRRLRFRIHSTPATLSCKSSNI